MERAITLFGTLGYSSNKRIDLTPNTPQNFMSTFDNSRRLNPQKALIEEWESVELLFQLTGEEIINGNQLLLAFSTGKRIDNSIIESYLFFAIELRGNTYTRAQLSNITREINKLFPMPALVLFRHGQTLTLSIINRRLHKRDESRDVLEKVTLIKDISCVDPHRAHLEILFDLSLARLHQKYAFADFVKLHQAWQKTLDSSELNKRFYREVANWYFWAIDQVDFPMSDGINDPGSYKAQSVIRLITRLIFVWFLKEKGLVPENLFLHHKLKEILEFTDPKGSTFYKALLQNLFFATLNQEMNTPDKPENRKFRSRNRQSGGRDPHYMIHNVYRYENYFKMPREALKLFASIPFLNGGLFECLDRPDENDPKKIHRIDGFSDRLDNELAVPDFLFFSGEQEVDLNEKYGTRNKRYKVRGLLDIFHSYKFTINENTPIEEEVALDPELLGMVFENLLASYNPETGATALKQTGSFYTPREIVNYMVDEGLIAFFEARLESAFPESRKLDERLRLLFSYSQEPHKFTGKEVSLLIEAIDTVKILDPACGSGAFPMGILHKLVFILSKLDPGNQFWKAKQITKASEIPDSTIREKVIKDIEQAFEQNDLDYGRKLYLIENCIYGVDIQPIAVQIAKLRFFISLVVDQKIDDTLENRGIIPLPNLETKFVAANTLIGIERPEQTTLRIPAIVEKEKELAEVRKRHFTARTLKTKEKYRRQDAQLRAEIGDLLRKGVFPQETIDRLAHWDPYDQNTSASFFDPEWMFNIEERFDVVISNPPYARVQTLQQTQAINVEYFKKHYLSAKGSFDIYVIFIEKGFLLLAKRGVFSFILPHKFFQAKFGEPIRDFLAKQKSILQIVRFGAEQVFDEATTYTCLLFLSKRQNKAFRLFDIKRLDDPSEILTAIQSHLPHKDYEQAVLDAPTGTDWHFSTGNIDRLLQKLRRQSHSLGDITRKIFQGIATSSDKIYVLQILEWKDKTVRCFSNALGQEVEIEKGLVKPFLMGKNVHRYMPLSPDHVVIFPYSLSDGRAVLMSQKFIRDTFPLGWDYLKQNKEALSDRERGKMHGNNFYAYIYPKNLVEFEVVKIVTAEIASNCQMTLDETGQMYHTTKVYSFVFKENLNDSLKYFLGVLNSLILWFFLKATGYVLRGGYFTFKTEYLKPFPIPCSISNNPPTKEQHDTVAKLVDRILAAKRSDPNTHTLPLEAQIDGLVAHLYGLTEEEFALLLSELSLPDPVRVAAANAYRDVERGLIK